MGKTHARRTGCIWCGGSPVGFQCRRRGICGSEPAWRALEIANDADLKSQVPPHWEGQDPTTPNGQRGRREGRIQTAGTLIEYEGRRYGSLSAVARRYRHPLEWLAILRTDGTPPGEAHPLRLPRRARCAARRLSRVF
jgi:hypothetical protein